MHDQLSTVLTALGDPARRSIVERLARGPATPKELAAGRTISPQAISRHLQVLETAGLIRRTRNGQQRPCHIDAKGLRIAGQWMDQHRAFWEGSFDQLASYLDDEEEQ